MKFAKRMERLGTENAFEVMAVVKKLQAQGEPIISFGIGEPDFDTPKNIKDTGIKAIQDNQTHYSPSGGIPKFREVVAKEIEKTRGMKVDPDEVVITPGGKPVIFHTVMALVEEGDEVIGPNPGYPIYGSATNFLGGKYVPLSYREDKEFCFDVDELISKVNKNTKLIVLNSPQNPTGGVLGDKELKAIADLAKKYDFWILSDEIYSRIIFEGTFKSIAAYPGMKERTVILDGMSKTYAMTGWRLGYGIMNKQFAAHMTKMMINAVSCTATFTQYAGIEALAGSQSDVDKMVQEFKERRDIIVDGLNKIKGIKCLKPHGAFYVFPNVTQVCKNLGFPTARELQDYLLKEAKVAILARTFFGQKNEGETEEYVRFSYATAKPQILEGLARIKKAVEK